MSGHSSFKAERQRTWTTTTVIPYFGVPFAKQRGIAQDGATEYGTMPNWCGDQIYFVHRSATKYEIGLLNRYCGDKA